VLGPVSGIQEEFGKGSKAMIFRIEEDAPDLLPDPGATRLKCGDELNVACRQYLSELFDLGGLTAPLNTLKRNKQFRPPDRSRLDPSHQPVEFPGMQYIRKPL